jgi:hypothetical protein
MALIIGNDVQWGNFKIKVGRSASASKSNLFLTKIFEYVSDICKVFSVATGAMSWVLQGCGGLLQVLLHQQAHTYSIGGNVKRDGFLGFDGS